MTNEKHDLAETFLKRLGARASLLAWVDTDGRIVVATIGFTTEIVGLAEYVATREISALVERSKKLKMPAAKSPRRKAKK